MTPQEKAHDLFRKYLYDMPLNDLTATAEINYAKHLALIAIDEMIGVVSSFAFYGNMWSLDNANGGDSDNAITFYQQVKEEISKL